MLFPEMIKAMKSDPERVEQFCRLHGYTATEREDLRHMINDFQEAAPQPQ